MPVPNLQPFSVSQCIQEALETNPVPGTVHVALDFPDPFPRALGDLDQLRDCVRQSDSQRQGGHAPRRDAHDSRRHHRGHNGGLRHRHGRRHRGGRPASHHGTPVLNQARGLGLGLAIARAILEKNRGTLRLTSDLGRGTTFTSSRKAASLQSMARSATAATNGSRWLASMIAPVESSAVRRLRPAASASRIVRLPCCPLADDRAATGASRRGRSRPAGACSSTAGPRRPVWCCRPRAPAPAASDRGQHDIERMSRRGCVNCPRSGPGTAR